MISSLNTFLGGTNRMRVALISCVSLKLDHPAPARELYTSPLFKKAYAYAKSLEPGAVYILSAEHGLVPEGKVLAPYNTTLNSMGVLQRKNWSERVLTSLRQETNLETDEFIVLAGERYREFLIPHMKHYTTPLKGLGIGRQLAWLSQHVK